MTSKRIKALLRQVRKWALIAVTDLGVIVGLTALVSLPGAGYLWWRLERDNMVCTNQRGQIANCQMLTAASEALLKLGLVFLAATAIVIAYFYFRNPKAEQRQTVGRKLFARKRSVASPEELATDSNI